MCCVFFFSKPPSAVFPFRPFYGSVCGVVVSGGEGVQRKVVAGKAARFSCRGVSWDVSLNKKEEAPGDRRTSEPLTTPRSGSRIGELHPQLAQPEWSCTTLIPALEFVVCFFFFSFLPQRNVCSSLWNLQGCFLGISLIIFSLFFIVIVKRSTKVKQMNADCRLRLWKMKIFTRTCVARTQDHVI